MFNDKMKIIKTIKAFESAYKKESFFHYTDYCQALYASDYLYPFYRIQA